MVGWTHFNSKKVFPWVSPFLFTILTLCFKMRLQILDNHISKNYLYANAMFLYSRRWHNVQRNTTLPFEILKYVVSFIRISNSVTLLYIKQLMLLNLLINELFMNTIVFICFLFLLHFCLFLLLEFFLYCG